jgi:hypothetical protein
LASEINFPEDKEKEPIEMEVAQGVVGSSIWDYFYKKNCPLQVEKKISKFGSNKMAVPRISA